MKNIPWLLLLLLAGKAFSQVPALEFKYGLMLSNESSAHSKLIPNYDVNGTVTSMSQSREYDLLHVVPSFIWQTAGSNFNEVAIQEFTFRVRETLRTDQNSLSFRGSKLHSGIALRLSHYHRFWKESTSPVQFLLGLEVKPYAENEAYTSNSSTTFPSRFSQVGTQVGIRPQFLMMPSKHIFMQFGLSSSIMNFQAHQLVSGDPTLPENQRRSGSFEFRMLPGDFTLHCGVGLRI